MSEDLSSGKGHRDENFPVASWLIARRNRPVVMAFYAVARMADDIADHATAPPREKAARLDAIEASLTGSDDSVTAAARLHAAMAERGVSPRHIFDLLEAFRRDVRKTRYETWAELMDYCRYSAAPVGRFVLDVHGESQTLWPLNDALCAALQVINHLQDCGADYRQLNRVYLPMDLLDAAGVDVMSLRAKEATPALRGVIVELAKRARRLLETANPFARQVKDTRLALEIGAIHQIAVGLTSRLIHRDPLSESVHFRGREALGSAALGAAGALIGRQGARQSAQPAP